MGCSSFCMLHFILSNPMEDWIILLYGYLPQEFPWKNQIDFPGLSELFMEVGRFKVLDQRGFIRIAPAVTDSVNAKGWFVHIISHGSLTALDKAFFIPWESFFIAACLQQSANKLSQFCSGKIAIYLAAKLSVSPHGIQAYNWLNRVEPWMEFCSLGYTVYIPFD